MNIDSLPCCTEDVTENCEDMDESCHWQCKVGNNSEEFCVGGTDMYMQGFDVSVATFTMNIVENFSAFNRKACCPMYIFTQLFSFFFTSNLLSD